MDFSLAPFIALALIFVLMALGVPVFAALALSGAAGIIMVEDLSFLMARLQSISYSTTAVYALTIIPLFILMGSFAQQAGVGKKLFDVARQWVGHLPGGLAMASVLTSAGFAATSGSSVATAATVGSVAIPEMKKAGYEGSLSAGAVAAGGVLGVLIPPSVLLIFYAALTETSAGQMLVAGFLPGLLTAVMFMIGIYFIARNTASGKAVTQRVALGAAIYETRKAWQVAVLFLVVMGGIYIGFVTPTEAGALGAFVAFIMLLARRACWPGMTGRVIDSFRSTINTTVMILFTMLGAAIFSYFLTLIQVPNQLAELVVQSGLPPYLIVAALLLVLVPMGMFLDAFSMLVITIPIMFPTVQTLGFDPIWFGILVVKMCEIGLITPPVGLNVYVIAGIDRETPLHEIFKGASWFVLMEFITIAILFIFPAISTWLPQIMSS
ncbi:TRAP transporter large permease [Marinobacter sp. M3C]|jgi:tripartite ATP-independent transporter DctM subunit|uniref:TRAP transporter large permease n=1 Tax=unclassified Marinobacter TaxID=83889 RepID=UPI00200C1727|nr:MULTISPECIES: TRAP transporter large permease [unclassified Marinobacter]UQG56547.1 TRAP transporter large permease [Marinobacter sp. M4C]UQG62260.1 TRAP transporter large permease [Marinobacter sp. M3C]UQG65351.1 TRAP transporter large permease [Marinobacter sp. M2C]UQG69630.1 TRAP transporter large permease [Marinobacter sp. M1C]